MAGSKYFFTTVFAISALVSIESEQSFARDIEMRKARIVEGSISLVGKAKVDEPTRVIWEGTDIGETNRRGRFALVTTILPQDCTGDLQVGSLRRDVVVKHCGPKGVDGENGQDGAGIAFPVNVKIRGERDNSDKCISISPDDGSVFTFPCSNGNIDLMLVIEKR